ncbi:MAG: hypothetical protein JSV49_04535 [Thermoplasmata archaeon]|nr:MAG: hypothetical protein JSV49_04535 [Thermoplasmata archaeon]
MQRQAEQIQNWLQVFKTIGKATQDTAVGMYGTAEAREKLGKGAGGDITVKLDRVLEDIIIEHLRKHDNVKLISEEIGEEVFGTPEVVVAADPLDGSFNAKRGLPIFAVSLALAIPEEELTDEPLLMKDIKLGYVKNLISGDEYWAIRNNGAYKNGKAFRTPDSEQLNVFCVELSPDPAGTFAAFSKLLNTDSKIRCIGSLALDLCYTAEGIFDCVLDLRRGRCRVLDTAAGIIILEEAGGIVTDEAGSTLSNRPITVTAKYNMVGTRNKKIHKKIIDGLV